MMTSQELNNQIERDAMENGFEVEVIYERGVHRILGLVKLSGCDGRRSIYISAGIHGDEPGGSLAIWRLMKEGFFDDDFNWYIVPILNPTGFDLGTRENGDGIDLNRDYRVGKTLEVASHLRWLRKYEDVGFDLTINLHEDWESGGFYAYAIVPGGDVKILDKVRRAVGKVSPINLASEIEGSRAEGGFILHHYEEFRVIMDEWEGWPEAFVLVESYPDAIHFTFETASGQGMDQRVKAHCAAVRASVEGLRNVVKYE